MDDLSPIIFSLLPFVLFVVLFHKWAQNAPAKGQKSLPPSPPRLPVLGHLHKLGTLPHRSLQELSQHYGSIMLLHLGSRPALIVSSADVAREILKNNDKVFSSRPKMSIPDKLLYGSKDVGFSPYGEFWRKVRGISVLHLLSNTRVQSFRHVRDEEISLAIQNMVKISGSWDPTINLSHIFVSLTNNIAARVALGRKFDDNELDKSILDEFEELLGAFDVSDYIPWLAWINHFNGFNIKAKKVGKHSDDFMERVIEEHRKRGEGNIKDANEAREKDLVDVLLDIQRENKDTNAAIDNDVIKALTLELFGSGTQTTYTVLEWTMSELMRNPQAMEKLCNEVRAVAGGQTELTENDIEKLHYLKAVIKESLRLHPPVPILVPHESTENTNIKGYDIPAGTQVFVSAFAIGRDPTLWEDPEEFKPERFMSTNIDYRGMNFEFIPFGSGRRICPGITYAVAIIELTLARLIHKFNFALPDGVKGEDIDMTEMNGLAVHKKSPLFVVATPCQPLAC